MCLYPRLIKNRKYMANKKNGGIPQEIKDKRTEYVPVPCGRCKECKKQQARSWQIRLTEDIKHNKNAKFITLTFSDQSIKKLTKKIKGIDGYDLDNEIATIAVRRFCERHRKKYKKSIRHFLVTELGHEGTENIHLHGILFTKLTAEEIKKLWGYGFIWAGYEDEKLNTINGAAITYITKYITKIDEDHKEYQSKILTSPGIGKNYITEEKITEHRANDKDYYRNEKGFKMSLPTYYRNKIYNEEEREQKWIELLNKEERYIEGIKIRVSSREGYEKYYKILAQKQQENKAMGYGSDEINWQRKEYERQQRNAKIKERIERTNR